MTSYVVGYLVTGIIFLCVDAVWLSVMGRLLYRPQLGDMMLEKINFGPAIAFYLLYVLGMTIFAVAPAFASGRWTTALVYGLLFGFFAYATYDLTNQATLKNWSLTITLADLGWGAFVTGLSASLGYLGSRWILGALGG